jgi:hypothetical protein
LSRPPCRGAGEGGAITNHDSSGGIALTATSSGGEARGSPSTLVLDLLDWLAREPRTYRETIETWGSRCPRITPWEDAQESGLVRVTRDREADGRLAVVLTRGGQAALASGPRGIRAFDRGITRRDRVIIGPGE